MTSKTKATATIHFGAHALEADKFEMMIDSNDELREIEGEMVHRPGTASTRITIETMRLSREAFFLLSKSERLPARVEVVAGGKRSVTEGGLDAETLEFHGGEPTYLD